MTKDQFWQTIDEVNRTSLYLDQESRCARMADTLSRYPLEDILDWHLILTAYRQIADRNDLWAACTRLGAWDTDDGFSDFRSWLISRGREVYMNALRDPRSLDTVPFEGEKLNFETFAYSAVRAYNAELSYAVPDDPEPLFHALETCELAPQTVEDIRSEVPRQEHSGPDRPERVAFSAGCDTPEPQTIEELSRCLNVAFGYVCEGELYEEYMFCNTPENIASFIGSHLCADKIVVTDVMDRLVLNTIGHFIDECPDQELLEQIKEVLIPIQLGQAEPKPFFCPTVDEIEVYLAEREDMDMSF